MSDVDIQRYIDQKDLGNADILVPGIIDIERAPEKMIVPGIVGIDNVPRYPEDEFICDDNDIECILDQFPTGAGAPGIGITKTGTETKVTELFGFKLDENDDAFSIGAVLLVVVVVYVAKGFIDEFFARRIERYKKKIE